MLEKSKEKKVMEMLDEAEEFWREITRDKYPLFSDIKINKNPDQNMGLNDLIWHFSIDAKKGETMNTLILDPKEVYSYFEKVIVPLFNQNEKNFNHLAQMYGIQLNGQKISKEEFIDNLLLDKMIYLHFHELEHPMDSPYSKEDRKKINKALFYGILEAMPEIKKSDALKKAANGRNMALDMIADNIFYLRSIGLTDESLDNAIENEFKRKGRKIAGEQITHLPDGIITIWDVIEVKRGRKKTLLKDVESKKASAVFSLSRLPYAMMYVDDEGVRNDEFELFTKYLKELGLKDDSIEKRAKDIFKLMVNEQDKKELARLGIDANAYNQAVDIMWNNIDKNGKYITAKELVERTIYTLFTNEQTRHTAIKAYIKPFADLLSTEQSSGRSGEGGVGAAADASDMLDDILEDMDPDEANELLQQLEQEGHEGKGSEKLSKKAKFEYYRRNAKKIQVHSPKSEFQSIDLGNDRYVEKVESRIIGIEELSELDMNEIMELQEEFGYENPILVDLTPNKPLMEKLYELNTYEWKEEPIKSYTSVSTGLEVPDNFVLAVDSSSSMGYGDYMGTGCKYDILCMVTHGLLQGLGEVCKMTNQNTKVMIINFSDETISSDFQEIIEAYKPATKPIDILHSFQNGWTGFDTAHIKKAEKTKAPGKTLYAFITDGGFNRGPLAYDNFAIRYFEKLASQEGNAVVFIEIQGQTSLGRYLEQMQMTHDNLRYYSVDAISEISEKLGGILIQYKR